MNLNGVLESWTFVRLADLGKDKEKDIYKRGRNGLGWRQWYRMFLFLSWWFRSLNLPGPNRPLLDNRLFWTSVWINSDFFWVVLGVSEQKPIDLGEKQKEDRVGAFGWWLAKLLSFAISVSACKLNKWLMTTITILTLPSITVYPIGLFSFCPAMPEWRLSVSTLIPDQRVSWAWHILTCLVCAPWVEDDKHMDWDGKYCMNWVWFGEYMAPSILEIKEEVKKHTGINMGGNHIMRGKEEFLGLCAKHVM